MSKVIAVGSINTDFVVRTRRFPIPGETIAGESFAIYGGGKGANQAIAAARLGANVVFFGAVGADTNSDQRVIDLEHEGIDVANVLRTDGYGGVAIIQVSSESGENSIVLVPGANADVTPDRVERQLVQRCDRGDVISLQLEIPMETVLMTMTVCRGAGARNVLNAAPYSPMAAVMLDLVDVLIVNEVEAGQFLETGPITVDSASDAARKLKSLGVRGAVAITLGASGAWLVDDTVDELIPAPSVDVVDTTGAGDAFCGAVSAWLASGESHLGAVRAGVVAGAFAVQRHGAQPSLPDLKAVESLLKPN